MLGWKIGVSIWHLGLSARVIAGQLDLDDVLFAGDGLAVLAALQAADEIFDLINVRRIAGGGAQLDRGKLAKALRHLRGVGGEAAHAHGDALRRCGSAAAGDWPRAPGPIGAAAAGAGLRPAPQVLQVALRPA